MLLGAGEAKRKLYEVKLDPQYWYDKAIERILANEPWEGFSVLVTRLMCGQKAWLSEGVLEARNDFEVLDLPPQLITDMSVLKKAYRKISLSVHPDKLLGVRFQAFCLGLGANCMKMF